MGSSAWSKRKEVEIDYEGMNGEVSEGSGTTPVHARVRATLPWSVFLFLVSALATHSLILSLEIKHLRNDLQTSHEHIHQLRVDFDELKQQKFIKHTAEFATNPTFAEKKGHASAKNSKDAAAIFANDTAEIKVRMKRRALERPRRSRGQKRFAKKIGPCQLQGISGPNAPRRSTTPLQKPQSVEKSLLWRMPDTESQTSCFMSTKNSREYDAIEYVKITVPGYYYVYSQIAYHSKGLFQSGHQVMLKRPLSANAVILMECVAPPIRVSSDYSTSGGISNAKSLSETKFTAGVFRLLDDDLIGIFPRKGGDEFQMLSHRSYWGLIYLGNY